MRYLIAFLMVSTAAWADDVDALKERYYEARPACRMAEFNGKAISKAESDKACVQLNKIGAILKKSGQCWDNGELEWRSCQ